MHTNSYQSLCNFNIAYKEIVLRGGGELYTKKGTYTHKKVQDICLEINWLWYNFFGGVRRGDCVSSLPAWRMKLILISFSIFLSLSSSYSRFSYLVYPPVLFSLFFHRYGPRCWLLYLLISELKINNSK